MCYTVSIDRVNGKFENGKYNYGGSMLFCKCETLDVAKSRVADEFKAGYYNHATIHGKLEDVSIERFARGDWRKVEDN